MTKKVQLFVIVLMIDTYCFSNLAADHTCEGIGEMKEVSKKFFREKASSALSLHYDNQSDEKSLFCTTRRLHDIGIGTLLFSDGCSDNAMVETPIISYCLDESGSFTKRSQRKLERFDMKGRQLRVAIVNDLSTFQLEERDDDEIVAFAGVDYQLLKVLGEKLNFSIRLLIAHNEDPRYANSTRTWPAAFDMLQKKEAELFLSHISINPRETDIVDYTIPYFVESIVFFGKVRGFVPKAYNLIKPFEVRLWIAVNVAFFIFGIILQQLFYAEYILYGGKKPSWKETFWYLSTTILCQAYADLEKPASRVIMILWLSMIFILTTCYSGILTSFMSLPIRYPPINTLLELERAVQENILKCVMYKDSTPYSLLTKSNIQSQKAIRQSVLENSGYDVEKITLQVESGKYVCIGEEILIEITSALMGKENYYFSKDSLSNTLVSIAVRKGMSIKNGFDILIRRMIEAGLINKWVRDLTTDMEKLYQPTEETNDSDLGGTQVAFLLLIAGYIIASIALILEMCVFKFQKRARAFPIT